MIKELVVFLQNLVGIDTIERITFDRLLPHEEIVLIDGPAQSVFYFQKKWWILLLIGSLIVAYISTSLNITAVALLVGLTALLVVLFGAVQLHYTRYVVTTNRILYMNGVIKRDHQWIPWAKVTDLSMEQKVIDRLLNSGTVRIDSANEESEFREMKDLTNPETMMRVLVYMVSQRQGSVPLPQDLHAILGVPSPDGTTYLPQEDADSGNGNDDDDGIGWGDPVDDGNDPGGGGDDGDATALLSTQPRSGPAVAEGPLAPGTVTVPRPAQGEESRPSRANPVQDVGAHSRRRRPDPPSGGLPDDDDPPDDEPPPDPGGAAIYD